HLSRHHSGATCCHYQHVRDDESWIAEGSERDKLWKLPHFQPRLLTQKSTKITNLRLKSRIYFRHKLLKWFHHHNKMVLPSLTFPGSNNASVKQYSRMHDPTPNVNTLCVLGLYSQVSLLITEQIDIEAWQQPNNGNRCGQLVKSRCLCFE